MKESTVILMCTRLGTLLVEWFQNPEVRYHATIIGVIVVIGAALRHRKRLKRLLCALGSLLKAWVTVLLLAAATVSQIADKVNDLKASPNTSPLGWFGVVLTGALAISEAIKKLESQEAAQRKEVRNSIKRCRTFLRAHSGDKTIEVGFFIKQGDVLMPVECSSSDLRKQYWQVGHGVCGIGFEKMSALPPEERRPWFTNLELYLTPYEEYSEDNRYSTPLRVSRSQYKILSKLRSAIVFGIADDMGEVVGVLYCTSRNHLDQSRFDDTKMYEVARDCINEIEGNLDFLTRT